MRSLQDQLGFWDSVDHGLPRSEVYKRVLLVGSAPDAPSASGFIQNETIVVAINNAWRALPRYDYLLYSGDFPELRKPGPEALARRGRSVPHYWPIMRDCGGMVCCGASMAFATGYWAARAFPSAEIGFLACDMVYDGDVTHFYGQGTADPLRRDISLQSLEAKSCRLFYFGLLEGCLLVNHSLSPESRLRLPRIASNSDAFDRLRERLKGVAGEIQRLASEALAVERASGLELGRFDYWKVGEDRPEDWKEIAHMDEAWLRLDPLLDQCSDRGR